MARAGGESEALKCIDLVEYSEYHFQSFAPSFPARGKIAIS